MLRKFHRKCSSSAKRKALSFKEEWLTDYYLVDAAMPHVPSMQKNMNF